MSDLSADVLEEITEVISIFDKVGDGKIHADDLINALRALGCNPSDDAWTKEIKAYEDEGMPRIDEQEFKCIYKEESQKTQATFKELCDGLKAVDPTQNDNGLLDVGLLKRYMTNFGDQLTDEQSETILKGCVVSSGQYVNITQVVRKVTTPVS